jgi:ABC-2 type transport system permease protein
MTGVLTWLARNRGLWYRNSHGMPASSGVAEDAVTGVHDRLRSLPIPRASVMVGRSLADTALSVWGLAVATVVAFIVGYHLDASALHTVIAIGVVLAAVYAFDWVFIALGLVSKSAQAANGTATLLIVPLGFVSAAYVPARTLPSWMRGVANNQPFTVISNALRSLVLGGPRRLGLGHTTTYWALLSLAWSAGILIVFSTIAVHRFARRR